MQAFALMLAASLAMVACGDASGDDPGAPDTGEDTPTGQATGPDAGADDGETVSLRYASPAATQSSLGQGAIWWADRLNEATDGRVEIELFQDSSLMAATDTLEGVRDGRAQLGYLASLFYQGQLPLFNVVGIPFISDDAEAIQETLYELYQSNDAFRAEFEDLGLRVLFFLPVGAGVMGFEEPVKAVEELSGRRVRSAGLWANAFQAAGSEPVFLETAELFEGLQRGVVDGFGGFDFNLAVTLGLHEAVPAFTQPGLGSYASAVVVMRMDDWNSLSEEVQAAFDEVSRDYMEESIQLVMESDERACDRLLDEGGTVNVLDQSQVEAWQGLVADPGIEQLWLQSAIDAGVDADAAESFLEDYRRGVEEREGQGVYEDAATRCASRE